MPRARLGDKDPDSVPGWPSLALCPRPCSPEPCSTGSEWGPPASPAELVPSACSAANVAFDTEDSGVGEKNCVHRGCVTCAVYECTCERMGESVDTCLPWNWTCSQLYGNSAL